jgi:formyl-CoA transferase/CoA:oxalate CoA-transferase
MSLEGIKILDMSSYLAGPYCSMILADLGADVIKVEQPETGDGSRQWGPPFIEGESAYFLSINRNKRSMTLNLKSNKGREVLYKLATQSDIFLENYRPGVTEKLGIDYQTLSKLNPRLIYCSISGYGQDGPYRVRPAYDIIGQAMSGLMSLTGEKDRPPVKVGIAIGDICSGMFAAIGILAALTVREKTGKGQMIDTSILDGMVAWLSHQAGNFLATNTNPERLGSAHPTIAPYQAFKAADSYFVVAVGNDSLWKTFCEALALNELMTDPKFATNPNRVKNRDELTRTLEKIFASKPAKGWVEIIDKAGVPCSLIYSLSEVFKDPQLVHRKMLETVQHPKAGAVKVLGVPIKMSDTPASIRTPPPMLGEHTKEILQTLGYKEAEINEMRRESTI